MDRLRFVSYVLRDSALRFWRQTFRRCWLNRSYGLSRRGCLRELGKDLGYYARLEGTMVVRRLRKGELW